MKSYFLAPISSPSVAITALSEVLPCDTGTWLLKDPSGDTIAYFSLVEQDDTTNLPTIQVDISGRHYNEDASVLAILHRLQTKLGGEIIESP